MEKPKDSKKVNRPIKKWRSSNFELALWSNEREVNGNLVEFKTMSLSRSFKKKDEDIWRSEVINNIRRNDISKIMAILRKVEDYLYFEAGKEEEVSDDE
jgi:glutaredoxin 2